MKRLREIYRDLWDDDRLRIGLKWLLWYSFASIFLVPLLLTQSWFTIIDYNTTGQVGDTINGIAGPFIAVLVAILTFLAFYVQFKANEQQRTQFQQQMDVQKEQFEAQLKLQKEQFDKELSLQRAESTVQDKLARIERFEGKFYELLRLHRANVDELDIASRVQGRKCFVQLFNELKYTYSIVTDQFKIATNGGKNAYAEIDLLKFSYSIFFYGVGVNSEKQLLPSLNEGEKTFYTICKKAFLKYQDDYLRSKRDNPEVRYFTFDLPLTEVEDERTKVFYYLPFNGHTARLGHFYRHLYQTVKYIVEQDEDLIDFDAKYSYVKMLRAQLSNHEQLLLYYNSAAWFNDEWKHYFTDYRLIKNIPLKLADFGVSPEEKYKDDIARLAEKGIMMFELHE